MLIIAIMVISAAISGTIASNNGMNVFAHVAMGLLLGLFGTAITAIMAKSAKSA